MRFRSTVFCLAVILSCLTHGSDTVYGQSSALLEAYNRFNTYYQQGQYAEALPYLAEALRLGNEELGPDHQTTATLTNNLALLYQARGNYAEAEPLLQRSLAIDEKALGPEHPHVAIDLNNLAALYDDQGNYAEAEPLYRRALAIVEEVLGPEHLYVAKSLNNMAALYDDQGNYAPNKLNPNRESLSLGVGFTAVRASF